jgi:hypothetical protein
MRAGRLPRAAFVFAEQQFPKDARYDLGTAVHHKHDQHAALDARFGRR